jgi:hypothetical protein
MKARFGRQSGTGVSFFAFQDTITGTSGFLIVLTLFLALNLDEALVEGNHTKPYAKREEDLRSMQSRIVSTRNLVADLQNRPAEDETTLRRMIGQWTSTVAELESALTPGLNKAFDATAMDRELRDTKQKLLTRTEKMNASIHQAELLSSGLNKEVPDLEKKIKDAESSLQRVQSRRNVISLVPELSDNKKEPILVLVQASLIRFQRANGQPAVAGSIPDFVNYLRATTAATHYVVFYFKPSGANHFESLTRIARQEGFEIGYDVIPEGLDVEFHNSVPVTKP